MTRAVDDNDARIVRWSTTLLGLGLVAAAIVLALLGGVWSFGAPELVLVLAGAGVALAGLLPIRWTQRVLTVALATCLAAGTAEFMLRLRHSDGLAAIYRPDPLLLYRLDPGSRKGYRRAPRNGGDLVHVEINADGFRGAPLRASGARRVVVYGDSCVAAEFSALENTFVQRLSAGLGARLQEEVEVINAGVAGYGPDQAALYMDSGLARLDAQLAVLVLFADNDYGDLMRNRIFSLGADGGLQRNDYRLSPQLRARFLRARRLPYALRLVEKVRRAQGNSSLDEWVAARDDRLLEWLASSDTEYREAVIEQRRDADNVMADHYDADIALTPTSESSRYKARLMEQLILWIRDVARREGVQLAILILPSPIDVCDEYDLGWVDPERWPEYRPSTLSTTMEQIAERAGVPCLNLFEPFRERGARGLYFRYGNDHWNDAGQAFAAELMTDLIADGGLLP